MTVKSRSLDPQSAELMSINLSGSINTLLPGTKTLPPPNLLFWKNTWLQQSEEIPGKKTPDKLDRKAASMLMNPSGYGIFHCDMESTHGGCNGSVSSPAHQTAQDTKDPKTTLLEMTVGNCRAEGRRSTSSLANVNVTCHFSPAWSSHPKT